MDPPWLAAANDAVDAMQHTAAGPAGAFEAHPPLSSEEVQEQIEKHIAQFPDDPGLAVQPPSDELIGGSGTSLSGSLTFPEPFCQPFRQMIDCDGLIERLEWILGPNPRLDHDRGVLVSAPGSHGHSLHSGPNVDAPAGGAPFALGYNNSVNVAWQMRDVPRSAGGFAAVPGSQRSQLTLPRERPTSIDLPVCMHVPMHAGDCLVFLAGQVTHGAFRWNGPEHRRVCMHNYVPWQHADKGTFREPAPEAAKL